MLRAPAASATPPAAAVRSHVRRETRDGAAMPRSIAALTRRNPHAPQQRLDGPRRPPGPGDALLWYDKKASRPKEREALTCVTDDLRLLTDDSRLATDDLRSANLPWRRRLAAGALGRLGRHLVCVVVFLAAAAQPLGRRAQAAADALGLRLLLGRRFRLGLRVVLAAEELDLRDLRAVAFAVSDPQQACVAARTIREAGRERVEQLRDHLAVLQILHDQPPRRQLVAVLLAAGD